MAVDVFTFNFMEMFVLYFLQQEDAHGYELVQKLEEKSGGLLTLKTASLYPILYKLSDQGCVSSTDVLVERKSARTGRITSRVRIVYHIEEPGRERLKELLEKYAEFTQGCCTILEENEGGNDHEG